MKPLKDLLKPPHDRSLALKRETLRRLDDAALAQVAGGTFRATTGKSNSRF
jgi:hypothetical protein